MYYGERKKKTEPSKLIKELAIFVIIDIDRAVLKTSLLKLLGISERTLYRYLDELNKTGAPKVGTNSYAPREISYIDNYDYCDDTTFDLSMLLNTDSDLHMRKLRRLISIYCLFRSDFYNYLYFTYDSEEYYYDYDEDPTKVTSKRFYKKICQNPKENPDIPLRTIERDIKDIYSCLNFLAENYDLDL